MAVGFHKLNSSAARAKRSASRANEGAAVSVTPAGVALIDPTYGRGETLEEFVSGADMVRCRFDSGLVVVMRGSAVLCGIHEAAR